MSATTTPRDAMRAALLEAAEALVEEVAADPDRRAILCETFVDTLLGTLQLAGALALKDRARSAVTTH